MNQRVLVTGSSGAVGSRAIEELLRQGMEPVGYDLFGPTGSSSSLGEYPFVRGDILDWPRLLDTVHRYKIERIVHTAALLPGAARANPHQAVQVNVLGTANIIEVVRLTGMKRLVFTSTKGVYADFQGEYGHPDYQPITEDYPVIAPENNHTLYNDTKLFCEHYLNKCRKFYPIDVVSLRFANMYGPGRVRHGSRALASEIIENAFYGRPTEIPQGGDEKTDMVYIRDVARAIVLATLAESLEHHTFNIGSGIGYTLAEVAEVVQRHLPRAEIRIGSGLDPFRHGFLSYGVFDISRARNELGYEPKYPFEAGIDDYLQFLERGADQSRNE